MELEDFIPKVEFVIKSDYEKIKCYIELALETDNIKEKDYYLKQIKKLLKK